MDGQITPVHLIQPLYKHLMGWPVTFKDLEHIDDQVGSDPARSAPFIVFTHTRGGGSSDMLE
jgi:hypothetical protein